MDFSCEFMRRGGGALCFLDTDQRYHGDAHVCWRVLRFKGGQDTATSAVFTQGSLAAEYMRMKYARHNFARHHGVLSLAHTYIVFFFPEMSAVGSTKKNCNRFFFSTVGKYVPFSTHSGVFWGNVAPCQCYNSSLSSKIISLTFSACAPRSTLRRLK